MQPIRFSAIIMTLGCLISGQSLAQATTAGQGGVVTTAKAGARLSSGSEVGELLDNPAAKAVLIKHVPALAQDDQIEPARSLSLRSLQQYAPDALSDQLLAKIDADLAQLPANPAPGSASNRP